MPDASDQISIQDFSRVKLVVGEVKEVLPHPRADKLLLLKRHKPAMVLTALTVLTVLTTVTTTGTIAITGTTAATETETVLATSTATASSTVLSLLA